ncbi:DUF1858 domain-containing protein [Sinanaerobacter chloroacetimidivorans]|uniref:DUF1858 domain-containing protein n=1 Tax=Sinanaerobacter chloroacetimidivorans TaxID=2818044 RepID=A0A8J7W047_9FIRM|nr:DUF1858 domain-containing protein [Sinanaerobacter chloroacetimidivorans]MBR0598337.1 DUF1858 domain-containing protein [Sinanaerobacter chloroacetimidivorans]
MKITEAMLLNDILDMDPEISEVLLFHGLYCQGCPGARNESLKEAAEGHGIDLQKLISDLNDYLSGRNL